MLCASPCAISRVLHRGDPVALASRSRGATPTAHGDYGRAHVWRWCARVPPRRNRRAAVILPQRPPPLASWTVPGSASPRIVLDRVSKCYPRALALDRVTVTIQPGEFV